VTGNRTRREGKCGDRTAVEPGGSWTLTATDGWVVSGYLPGWADQDPSEADVPAEELSARLAEICHYQDFPGQRLRFTVVSDNPAFSVLSDLLPGPPPCTESDEIEAFLGGIVCRALDDGSASHAPTVNMDILPGYVMDALTPDDLADLAVKLRAQADRIECDIRPKLIAAREDWTTQHQHRGPFFSSPGASGSA